MATKIKTRLHHDDSEGLRPPVWVGLDEWHKIKDMYSADTIAQYQKVRGIWRYQWSEYINTGVYYLHNCIIKMHEVMPEDEYEGEVHEYTATRHTYEGCRITYKGKKYVISKWWRMVYLNRDQNVQTELFK